MVTPFSRFVDWWIPHRREATPDDRWRARFLVRVLFVGIAVSTAMLALYLANGVWPLAAQTAGIALGLLGCVSLLRFRAPWTVVVHLGLTVVAVAFTATPLHEQHFDGAAVAWFSIIPFIAVLLLGPRGGRVWVPIVLLLMVGLYLQPERPGPWLPAARFVTLARTVGLMFTVLAFGLSFQEAQREARERLEQANLARSRFFANMSHELRTPMNGVLGMVEVMLRQRPGPELAEQLELVRQSGKAMVALVNAILDVSKIEAGKLVLEARSFSLAGLLDEVEGLYRPVAANGPVAFSVTRSPGVATDVVGDSLRLRQVLCNLLDNALKFTTAGQVQLRVEAHGAATRFTVADTGPGIAPGVAARLFSPFEQADSSTTRRYGGSGLGLALARQLVELMGGRLLLDSAPGQGARFSFELTLPRAPPFALASADSSPGLAVAAAPGQGRVLVVDDNPINLRVASSLVRSAGYEVGEATDGRRAVEAVERERWDAVLMDCHMPEMDGLEATRRIRALAGPAAGLPIIALTAAAMPDELEACREAGMTDTLTKPVNFDALKVALARALRPR